MKRRELLKGLISAPFIVSAGVLMPVRKVISASHGILYGDGIMDDTVSLCALLQGKPVQWPDGSIVPRTILDKKFKVSGSILISANESKQSFLNCEFKSHVREPIFVFYKKWSLIA